MAQITLAANEKAFRKLYERVRDAFEFTASDSGDFGPFSAGYDIKTTLEGGDVDLRADNTVKIDELDIKWDKLDFHLGLDLPRICVGGFCIVPNPFGGCLVRAPRICVFGADPDISITLPLGGIVTSEISFTGSLYFKYFINSARPIGMDDWEAAESSQNALTAAGRFPRPIVTQIAPLGTFYRAEEYHQQYFEKRGRFGCRTH